MKTLAKNFGLVIGP